MSEATAYRKQQAAIALVTRCLVGGGHTQNGPLKDFWEISDETGLGSEWTYHALQYMIDGRPNPITKIRLPWIEEQGERIGPKETFDRILKGREYKEHPIDLQVRLTEEGMRIARDEIGLQHIFKQLSDFDTAVKRASRSLSFSGWSLGISLASMLIAALALTQRACSAPQGREGQNASAGTTLERPAALPSSRLSNHL